HPPPILKESATISLPPSRGVMNRGDCRETLPGGGDFSQDIAEGAMMDSTFWLDKAERFSIQRKHAIQQSFRRLGASFHPEGWGLEEGRAFGDTTSKRWMLNHATPQATGSKNSSMENGSARCNASAHPIDFPAGIPRLISMTAALFRRLPMHSLTSSAPVG